MKIGIKVTHSLYPDVRKGKVVAIGQGIFAGSINVLWEADGTFSGGPYFSPARFIKPFPIEG